MLLRWYKIAFGFLLALAFVGFGIAPKQALAQSPTAPNQTYDSEQEFWATPNDHLFLFLRPGAPCYGQSVCFIDTYTKLYPVWWSTPRWLYSVTYGNHYANIYMGYKEGEIYTGWTTTINKVTRWRTTACAGKGTSCRFTARRIYINDSGKQREEIFAYGKYWIFVSEVPSSKHLLATGPICAADGVFDSYQMFTMGYFAVPMPPNISCPTVTLMHPTMSRKRP